MEKIAVFGSSNCPKGSEDWEIAELVGTRLAAKGYTPLHLGYGGVAEAVAVGAQYNNVGSVGYILDSDCPMSRNPYCHAFVHVGDSRNESQLGVEFSLVRQFAAMLKQSKAVIIILGGNVDTGVLFCFGDDRDT